MQIILSKLSVGVAEQDVKQIQTFLALEVGLMLGLITSL
jgi:hypothetical protein